MLHVLLCCAVWSVQRVQCLLIFSVHCTLQNVYSWNCALSYFVHFTETSLKCAAVSGHQGLSLCISVRRSCAPVSLVSQAASRRQKAGSLIQATDGWGQWKDQDQNKVLFSFFLLKFYRCNLTFCTVGKSVSLEWGTLTIITGGKEAAQSVYENKDFEQTWRCRF